MKKKYINKAERVWIKMDKIEVVNNILDKHINSLSEKVESIICSIYHYHTNDVRRYFFEHIDIVLSDVLKYTNIDLNEYLMLNMINLYEYDGFKDQDNNQELIEKAVIIHVVNNIIKFSKIEEKPFNEFNKNKINNSWYRGHSDKSWNLIPSFFRTLNDNRKVNKNFLRRYYRAYDILDKVNELIPSKRLNYEQMSFLQHSMSITPLLDFSSDYKTSLSFAVNNLSTPVDLKTKDSSLFELKVKEEDIIKDIDTANKIIGNLNVYYFNKKTYVSTIIKNELWLDLINGNKQSSYHLIDIKTNDRMRIQRGTFVLFDNVLIFDSDLYFSTGTNDDLSSLLTKYNIDAKKGERYNIYKEIVSGARRYHINYMLNPYEFMHTL